ncbi:MAG: hypothetical protein WBM09_00120 [Gallionella sp.]
MDNLDSRADAEMGGDKERRTRHNLRQIFGNACRITAPFFDPAQSWAGSPLTMYARQTLRETYPELTQQEMAILLSVVTRFYKETEKYSP